MPPVQPRLSVPWLSVIVPLSDPAQDAAECLRSLAACGEPGLEVILAGHISAGVIEQAKDFPLPLRHIMQPDAGAGAARNLGAAQARGEILFFTLPDCRVAPGLPARLKELFADPDLSAVGGTVRPLYPDQPLSLLSALEIAFEKGDPEDDQEPCPAMACAGFRAADFRAAGMCNEVLTHAAAGDQDLCHRIIAAGGLIAQDDGLWVKQDLPRTWGQVWRGQIKHGQARYQELRIGLRLDAGAYIQPVLLLLALGLLIMLGPQDPGRAATLALICILLLYPANRAFLKYVGQEEPGMLRTAFLFCLLRPAAWLLGMLQAALGRLGFTAK
jgi:glycosyltransferase involved in cell wall biosynthesis